MLRTAKVLFAHSVVDCLVLDESGTGVRVSTEILMPFPERVVVELRSGSRWKARRRWQRGLETGFEYSDFDGLNPQAAAEAQALYARLCNAGTRDVTARLAEKNSFDHPELKNATQALDRSLQELERILRLLSI